ncbi:MAG: coproporphyrinogen dehydrogenase HemZ [Eubacteriales bacterium]
MYSIVIKNKKFHHDVEELIKLFMDKNSFRIIENTDDTNDMSLKGFVIPDHLTGKQEIKRFLYNYFSENLKYYPPWGTLTGIRPTKIVNELFNNEKSEDEVRRVLSEEYLLHMNKIDLLIATTMNQSNINKSLQKNSISIYIGIPFCPSRCSYCSFTSYEINEDRSSRYLQALFKEISHVSKAIVRKDIIVENIYIGGGTPTSLSNRQFQELLQYIDSSFDLKKLKEFTVEAGRPDTINQIKLDSLVMKHCNRISINPQSMNEKTLIEIGRKHTVEEFTKAYALIKETGIKAVNMDLIAGLPNENIDDFKYTVEKVAELCPENITIHNLAIKRAARLKDNICKDESKLIKPIELVEMIESSYSIMLKNSYLPYYLYRQKDMLGNLENIGYSKKGYESIYNVRIMEENQTIIALGAGGVSKIYYPEENRLERIPNVSNFQIYIDRIDEMIKRKNIDIFE